MRSMYLEDPIRAEVRMKHEELAHAKQMHGLAQIATGGRASALDRLWVSVTVGLNRLAESGSRAVRSALVGPSEPSEQCC
jgi:hypothetical protein